MSLEIRPIHFKDAASFITEHHRHHKRPTGWKFGTSVWDGDALVGVIIVGRPVARMSDDGTTLEVTRCCTTGAKNACSMLYAAAWRAAKALGYTRMITYTLAEENGSSLRASGWKEIGVRGGGEWHRDSRPRHRAEQPGQKVLWEAV